jgi:sterol desaturase/sphingolipid hydroxylase (fatty acid hydroxylase superfamily)
MIQILEGLSLALLPVFLSIALVYGARRYDTPRGWRLYALAVSAGIAWLSIVLAQFWAGVFDGWSLVDGSVLGTAGGAVVGVLVYEFVHYWYHRAAHAWDWLWRAGHQMHHSAESVDAFGAYYLHPLDAALFGTWASLVFGPLLGLTAEAGAIAAFFLAFNAVFQHANIATPRWLGYLIQRPESHSVHHERGVHAYNYSDLPLWDLAFGTFRNPASAAMAGRAAGFYKGASGRIGDMLAFQDVSAPHASEPSPAQPALAKPPLAETATA